MSAGVPVLPKPWRAPDERDPGWRHLAACRDEDPDLFFVADGQPSAAKDAQELRAKAVCRRCLVRAACLSWAVANGEATGVWGGLTADERETLRPTGARKGGQE